MFTGLNSCQIHLCLGLQICEPPSVCSGDACVLFLSQASWSNGVNNCRQRCKLRLIRGKVLCLCSGFFDSWVNGVMDPVIYFLHCLSTLAWQLESPWQHFCLTHTLILRCHPAAGWTHAEFVCHWAVASLRSRPPFVCFHIHPFSSSADFALLQLTESYAYWLPIFRISMKSR